MKKIIFALTIVALFLMTACQPQVQEPLVGGDKDEHGCIASAGYTWCESKQKCLRSWEEECPLTQEEALGPPAEAKAVEVAKAYVAGMDEFKKVNGQNIQIIQKTQGSCTGCWIIDVDYYSESKEDPAKLDKATVKLTMESWEVINANFMTEPAEMLTPKGCALQGGRVVNTFGDKTCDPGETNIGAIKAFRSPHICCKVL